MDNRFRILHMESQSKGIVADIEKSLEGVLTLPVNQAKNHIGRFFTTFTTLKIQSMSKYYELLCYKVDTIFTKHLN